MLLRTLLFHCLRKLSAHCCSSIYSPLCREMGKRLQNECPYHDQLDHRCMNELGSAVRRHRAQAGGCLSTQHCLRLFTCARKTHFLSLPTGPGQDPSDHFPAGIPLRVPGHLWSPHGHCAQVHPAQLDERVQEVVPSPPDCQVPWHPRSKGEHLYPVG